MLGLIKAEKELSYLLDLDKRNWTHFYLLLKEIEEHELWKEKYSSFTQWVKDFSVRTKTHESIIWNRKKAGKVYESYAKIQKERGIEVTPIQDIKVSADSLVILDKINRYDPLASADLTDKVMNKEITKKDLREVYHSIRPHKISNNPHISHDNEDDGVRTEKAEQHRVSVTASEIVATLCNIEWLSEKKERKYFRSSYEQDKYRTFTEFPVYTGTSKKSRRIDVLAAENVTTENIWGINLHGIEIKISKSDLVNDQKYSEYAEFVDYLWIAVPAHLVDEAKNSTFRDCGIISVSKSSNSNGATASIVKKAKKINALKKIDTLTSIALKLI